MKTGDTKQMLAASLKEQLASTPLDRITVAGLVRRVGVTRQAFYYHFGNVYELAAWLFEQEIANHIMAHATYDEWADGFEQLLTYMRAHPVEVKAVVASLSPGELERFFYAQFCAMMRAIVTELSDADAVQERIKDSVVRHFAVTALGYFLHWLSFGMREDPTELVGEIKFLLRGQVQGALGNLTERRPEW